MADISRIARVNGGLTRNLDLTTNSLVMSSLKLGTSELTKAKLDLLAITTDSATAVDASAQHTHDGRYRTQSELSSVGATSGADVIGTNNTPSNYSAAAATVQDHLEGIDSALATAGGTAFDDSTFRINDNTTPTKQIAFEASGITASTVRTITMPDANVDLGDIATNNTFRTNLGLTTNGNGASLISIENSAAQFTSTNVEGALTEALDAAQAAQATADDALPLTGGTMSGAIAMGTNKITGMGDGTAPTDAATYGQLQTVTAGIDLKESVRLATNAALPAYTAAGGPGVGRTLTANAVGILTVDGVATVLGDRIIVKNEGASDVDHGIWEVTTEGTAGVAFVLTRATDADEDSEVTSGMFAFVQEGTQNGNTGWAVITSDPITVDTTPIQFSQFQGLPSYTASLGVDLVGVDFRLADAVENASGIKVLNGAITLEDLGAFTTDDLTEGTNKFATAAQLAKVDFITVTQAVDLDTVESDLAGHLNGGANKHDASEVDYERLDGSKKNIQAASDDIESAVTDLDDAIGALAATPTNYTPTDAGIVADHLAAIDGAIGVASGANTSLSNLTTTDINQSLIPTSTSVSLGTNAASEHWNLGYIDRIIMGQGTQKGQIEMNAASGAGRAFIQVESSRPSGPNADIAIKAIGSNGGTASLLTNNSGGATATQGISLETGNNTSTGDTGDILIRVGSVASGTQGEIKMLKAGDAPTVGDIWTATNADGSGYWATPAEVDSTKTVEVFTVGEVLTAGNRALRMADSGETAGRVYFADNDASVDDDFYVVGLAVTVGESIGSSVEIVKSGPITMTAHGFTLGRPVYLDATGALTSTAPSAADTAVVKVGMVRDANTVEVQIQTMGVN
jgi:hypothetical protein